MSIGPHKASVKPVDLARPGGLDHVPLGDLVRETIARLDGHDADRESVRLLVELARCLEGVLNTSENRFSAAHLQELLGTYFFWQREFENTVQGEVFLELGAGAEAPLQLATAMVCLGAARGYGLELTPPLSVEAHARGLADMIYWLLARPDQFAKIDLGPVRETMVRAAQHFDVGALAAGRLDLPDTVQLLVASAEQTGLAAGSVHRVASTSFLEHVDDPDAVVAEIARVTADGGLSIHNIDTADHGAYWGEVSSPVAFLLEQPGRVPVRGCNRLRIADFVRLFEKHGFTVLRRNDYQMHEWQPQERQALVEPYSAMPAEELAPLKSVLVMRRDRAGRSVHAS